MAEEFTQEQKEYLAGFAVGAKLSALNQGVPTFASAAGIAPDALGPKPSEHACYDAQDITIKSGKKLTNEEQAKRKKFPLDQWGDLVSHAAANTPPKGTDVLAFKYFGLFWVAPAQDSFMSRLRFPGGIVKSYQMKGVADLADLYGGGYTDVTTRANLQVREISPDDTVQFLEGLYDLGIVNKGSGADNIRNITASPLAGIDPDELIDTRQVSRDLNHHILNHRELFGLPRKFNIAFDGAGRISALEDTNDIGFTAVRVKADQRVAYRLTLGGITGHKDFARDTGILIEPADCIAVSHAILKAFIEHGDRTDRKKARLKYVLDRMGFDGFIKEVEKHYGKTLARVALTDCEPRRAALKNGHVGFHAQRQPGLAYAGVVVPVGRLTSQQMRHVAAISDRFGSGTIRLTVWQNLVISDIKQEHQQDVERELELVGLSTRTDTQRGNTVACTGNVGCKFANANTKKHAIEIADHIDETLELDVPINLHVTGCPHSCAQHYIGDIGLLGTKVAQGEDMVEGYHLYVGGGYGTDQSIARELARNVVATSAPQVVESLVRSYLERRQSGESFNDFVRRHDIPQLKSWMGLAEVTA
jgi:ferredoxin-nitrite reductase